MASRIKVRMKPNEVFKIFEDTSNNDFYIKFYSFLGVEKEGDKDADKMLAEEWDALADTPCIFDLEIRHGEFPCLREENWIYSSWKSVVRALNRKKKLYIDKPKVEKEKAELIEMIKSGEIFSVLRDHFYNIELYDKEEYISAFIYKDWFDCKFARYGNYLLTLQNIHPSVGYIRDDVLDSLSITEYIKFSLFDMNTNKVLKTESWKDVWTILNDAKEKGEV